MSFNSPQPTNFAQTRCRGAFYDNESTPVAADFKMGVLRTPGKQYNDENSYGAQSGSNTTQTPKPFQLDERSAEQHMPLSQPFEPSADVHLQAYMNQSDLNTPPVNRRVVSEESPFDCDRKVASKFMDSQSPMVRGNVQVSSWECNARRSQEIAQNMTKAPVKVSAQDRFKAAASPQVSSFDSSSGGLFASDPFKDNEFKATAMAAQPRNQVQASSFLFNLEEFENEPLRLSPQSKSQEQDDVMISVDRCFDKNSRTQSTSSFLDTAISNTHIGNSLHNECKPFHFNPSPFDALDQHFERQFDESSPFEPVQDIPRASNFR